MRHPGAKYQASVTPLQDVPSPQLPIQATAGKVLHGQGMPGRGLVDRGSTYRDSLNRDLPNRAIPNEELPYSVSPIKGSTKRSSRNEAPRGQSSRRQRLRERGSSHQRLPDEDDQQQQGANGAASPRQYPPLGASFHEDPKPREGPHTVNEEENEKSSLRSNGKCINLMPLLKIPVIAFVVAAVILFVTVWNTRVKPQAVKEPTQACTHSACLNHANQIKMAWNSSVPPCDNFYGFVCGAWAVQKKQRRMDDLVTAAKDIALTELRLGSRTATKARKLFRSCTGAARHVQSNLDSFKKWAFAIGLIQPRRSSQVQHKARRHPLDLLLDLAINWRTGLLSIRARAMFNKSQWTLVMKVVPSPWRAFLESENQASLVGQHAEMLDAWPPRDWKEWNRTVAAIRTAIFSRSDGRQSDEMAAQISDLDGLTPTLPKGLWLDLINKHFAPELKFGKADVVISYDTGMLTNIGRLFGASSLDPLTEVFSWIVVEKYLSLMVPAPGQRDVEVVSPRLLNDCLSLTNCLLGPLSVQQYLQQQFPESKRESVNKLLQHIRATWALSLERAPWIDKASKQRVLEKVETLRTVLWPSDKFFNSALSPGLHSSFPDMDKPFMDNVIETATVLRRLVNHSHFEDTYSRQILGEADLFLYRYFLNEVYIDLAALFAPIYYDVEMFPVRYGALGSLYAKEVTKMYDSTGRSLSANGEHHLHIFTEESAEYRRKLLCNATGDRYSSSEYFSHISGLETAFEAYSTAVSRGSALYDHRLYGLEELSSDQLFFVTYCHVLCAPRTDGDAEDMCNIPLRNFGPFAEAFRCATLSYMNPEQKCRFFALAKEGIAACGSG